MSLSVPPDASGPVRDICPVVPFVPLSVDSLLNSACLPDVFFPILGRTMRCWIAGFLLFFAVNLGGASGFSKDGYRK